MQTESPSALFLAAGDYHHHLGVNVWNGRSRPAGGRGLAWYEFLVPDGETLAAIRRGLADADIPVTDREEGFEVTDPSGIAVRFRAERRERSVGREGRGDGEAGNPSETRGR